MPDDFAGLDGRARWQARLDLLVARDGGEPVGAAALFVDGDTGWFTMGATMPQHRGRGAQGALFAERLRRAERLGLRRVVTETGAPVGDEGPGPPTATCCATASPRSPSGPTSAPQRSSGLRHPGEVAATSV